MDLNGTIIYVGGFKLPDKNAAAHRVLSNGKILRDIGYDVIFIDVSNRDENLKSMNSKRIIHGFEVWSHIYPESSKEWVQYVTDIKFIQSIAKNYNDVVAIICYNMPSIQLYKLRRFSEKNNIKLIADITEWYGAQGENVFKKLVKSIDTGIRMKYLQNNTDGNIVISNLLHNYYKDNVRTVLIPPLVDKKESKWKAVEQTNNETKIVFTYSGSPSKVKEKLDEIIKMFAESNKKNYVLNIIGITKDLFLEMYDLKNSFLEDFEDRVRFYGIISHEQSLLLLKMSDFSIFFRDKNRVTDAGFPTKLSESLSANVPVITNDYSDVRTYIKDRKNGYVLESFDKNIINKILSMPQKNIDNFKINVDENVFDYHNWIETMRLFMMNL